MSKFGEDTAPDVHGDDSYRAATNVVIQGKNFKSLQYLNILELEGIRASYILLCVTEILQIV